MESFAQFLNVGFVEAAFPVQDLGHDALRAENLGQVLLAEIVGLHQRAKDFDRRSVGNGMVLFFVCLNMTGCLAGGGTAPLVIGYLAERIGLNTAIATSPSSYVLAGLLLSTAVIFFVRCDATKMEAEIAASASPVVPTADGLGA